MVLSPATINKTNANLFYFLFAFGLNILAYSLNALFTDTMLRCATINNTERLSIFRQPPDI